MRYITPLVFRHVCVPLDSALLTRSGGGEGRGLAGSFGRAWECGRVKWCVASSSGLGRRGVFWRVGSRDLFFNCFSSLFLFLSLLRPLSLTRHLSLSLIRHLSLRPLSLSLSLLRPLSLSPLSPCFSLFILSPNLLFLRRYLCQSVWYFGIYDERRLHWQFRISYPTCLECRVAEKERKRIIREVFIQISSSSSWEKK